MGSSSPPPTPAPLPLHDLLRSRRVPSSLPPPRVSLPATRGVSWTTCSWSSRRRRVAWTSKQQQREQQQCEQQQRTPREQQRAMSPAPSTSTSSNGGEQDLRWRRPRLHGSSSAPPLICCRPSNLVARTPTGLSLPLPSIFLSLTLSFGSPCSARSGEDVSLPRIWFPGFFLLMVPRTSHEKISSHHGRLFCFFILSGTQPEKRVGATTELTHNLCLVHLKPHLYMTSMHLTLSQIFMEKVYACSNSADVR